MMRYTSFGWVDDDKNLSELVALNPNAYAKMMSMRQEANSTKNTRNINTLQQNIAINQNVPYSAPYMTEPRMNEYYAPMVSVGAGGKKPKKAVTAKKAAK
jgi:hypothetical protein